MELNARLVMASRIYRVDVVRVDDAGETWWGAEGGLSGSSSGIDFDSTTDVADLVAQVADNVDLLRARYPDLEVEWLMDGAPANAFLKLTEDQGVELP